MACLVVTLAPSSPSMRVWARVRVVEGGVRGDRGKARRHIALVKLKFSPIIYIMSLF